MVEPEAARGPTAETPVASSLVAEAKSARPKVSTKRYVPAPSVPVPASVSILSIGVQTRLVRLGLNADQSLQVPRSGAFAGWYTKGAAPGEVGPAVIVGHYDSVDGPAVFYRLSELQPGQSVQVGRADGTVVTFAVDRVKRFSKGEFPTDEVYGRVNRPELRLITCGGSFDYDTRRYRDNYVVFAHIV